MSRFEAAPHRLLAPYVRSYWGFARDFSELRSFTVTPDCFVELLYFVDPPLVEDARGIHRLSTCVLIPLLEGPIRIISDGVVRCAAVRFHAWGAATIVPESLAATGTWHDVSASFADATLVVDALRRDAWTEIGLLLDATLLGKLNSARSDVATSAAIRAFLGQPSADSPDVTTNDVALRHGLSRRQIERRVRTLSRFSPKQLACLSRFQFVRDALWSRPDTELKALALEAGYADQAHMSRDFRRFGGTTPGAFKRECRRLTSFLLIADGAMLQDEPAELA